MHLVRSAILMALIAVPASAADVPADKVAAALPELEKYAETLREKTGVPGIAIAVVHADKLAYLKGLGVRELGKPETVDPDTVFQLASVSKSVTATVLAGVVGDGKVTWDTRISRIDPGFRLASDYVTGEVTIRDLLCHRSGLPDHAGDLLEDIGYDAPQVLHRLRYQKLTGQFRGSYAYTNFGFSEAAYGTARVVDKAWADLAAERLFIPLGMKHTSYKHSDYAAATNRARLHARRDGKWVAKYDRQPDAQSPAGGASSNVRDLSQWLRLLLANGQFDGKQLVDGAALDETHKPQVISHAPKKATDRTSYYGLGWNVGTDAAGELFINHSGAFDLGAATCVALVPKKQIGIVVLTNGGPIGVPESIAFAFVDLVNSGKIERDWLATLKPSFDELAAPTYGTRVDYAKKPSPVSPALAATAYVGTYRNDFVGDATVAEENGGLVLKLGPKATAFPLTHFDRDVFLYQPQGENAAGLSAVTFRIGADRIADSVVLENLNIHGSGTLTRVPAGK